MPETLQRPAGNAHVEGLLRTESEEHYLWGLAELFGLQTGANYYAALVQLEKTGSFRYIAQPQPIIDRTLECLKNPKFRDVMVQAFASDQTILVPDHQLLSSEPLPGETQFSQDPIDHNPESESRFSIGPVEYHFFVPTFYSATNQITIWVQKTVATAAEAKSLARQLNALALLSVARQQNQNADTTEMVNKLSESFIAERNELQQQIAAAQSRVTTAKRSQELSDRISTTLDKEKSGFQTCSELQNFLSAERITLIDVVGEKHSVVAVSGQPTIDRRANIVRATERMVRTLGLTNRPQYFEGDVETLPASCHRALEQYLEESMVSSFAILPIEETAEQVYESEEQSLIEVVSPGRTHDRRITGAILAEYLTLPMEIDELKQQWSSVKTSVSNQHNNAKQYTELPLQPLQLMLKKFFALYRGHTKRLAFGLTALIVGVLLLSVLIPAQFRVGCEGVLLPANLRPIFSPKDAVVSEVMVKEGQTVKKDELLVVMTDLQLEGELVDERGRFEVLQAQLKANQHQRAMYARESPDDRRQRLAKLSATAIDLKLQIQESQQLIELMEQKRQQLELRAPFDGTVMGWNIDRKLINRPMTAGVRLMSIAPQESDWVLDLKVAGKRAGHVQTAFQTGDDQRLAADFTIASAPNDSYQAQVVHLNPGLEEDSDLGYVLPVEAVPNEQLPISLRSGTPVIAKINCGKRSFLYCKTYELVDLWNQFIFEYLY